MTTQILAAAAAMLTLLASAPAAAQQEDGPEPDLPAPGTMSLTLRHDAGSSAVGVGRMVGSRTRVDVSVGLGGSRERTDTGSEERTELDRSADLRLAVRRYAAPESRIAPFLLGAVAGFHYRRTIEADGPEVASYDASFRGRGIAIQAGGGVEWFPAARVGISGEAGVAAYASRLHARSHGSQGPATSERTRLDLRTFTSALSLALYF